MKYLLIFLLAGVSVTQAGQDVYVSKNASINLYSSAPIEDIEANSNAGISVYNPATGELDFNVTIRTLHFEKALMEEHFNENYMESDKYPKASFKGKMDQRPDLTKDGIYPVNVTGELEVHGIKQTRTVKGMVKVSGGVVSMTSEFLVKCADHHIDIPSIVFHHIAENIRVRIAATYTVYKTNNPSK